MGRGGRVCIHPAQTAGAPLAGFLAGGDTERPIHIPGLFGKQCKVYLQILGKYTFLKSYLTCKMQIFGK